MHMQVYEQYWPGLTYCWSICTCLCPLTPLIHACSCLHLAFVHVHLCLLICVLVPTSPCIFVLVPVHLCWLLAHLASMWPPFILIYGHSPCLFVLVPIFVWPSLGLICTCSFQASIRTCLCLHLYLFVPAHPLIYACSHLCLAFAWAHLCPPASCLCPHQIHN